jgi:hypothetical protein
VEESVRAGERRRVAQMLQVRTVDRLDALRSRMANATG